MEIRDEDVFNSGFMCLLTDMDVSMAKNVTLNPKRRRDVILGHIASCSKIHDLLEPIGNVNARGFVRSVWQLFTFRH